MFSLIGKALAQPTLTQVPNTTRLSAYFTSALNIILWIGGGLAVVYLVYGGIMYVTAGGDQEKATAARTAIVNAIIGIIIIALALALVTWANNAGMGAATTAI